MQFIKKGIEPTGLNFPVKGEGKGGELVIEFKNGLAIVVDAEITHLPSKPLQTGVFYPNCLLGVCRKEVGNQVFLSVR
jgi:hypothetical protein